MTFLNLYQQSNVIFNQTVMTYGRE